MADGITTNHGFTLPEVGLSKATWGTKLNNNWAALDAILNTTTGLFLARAGGTMVGQISMPADPTLDAHAARKKYVDDQIATRLTQAAGDARYLRLAGGTMTGHINMGAFTVTSDVDPALNTQLSRKAYVDAQVATRITQAAADARYLQLGGGTMTGVLNMATGVQININVEPTQGFHAARKNYVDGQVAAAMNAAEARLPLSGGTMSGNVTFSGSGWISLPTDPAAASHAARKFYVDNLVATRLTQAQGDARYVALAGTTAYGRGFLDITGEGAALQYINAVPSGRFLVGGPGMVNTIGNLTDNRTVSMGPPSDITATSENVAQGQTHTHRITSAAIGVLISQQGNVAIGSTITARNEDGPAREFGQTISGAALRYSGENGGVSTISGGPGGGTWQCRGRAPVGFSTDWLRLN